MKIQIEDQGFKLRLSQEEALKLARRLINAHFDEQLSVFVENNVITECKESRKLSQILFHVEGGKNGE